jgi:CubicO group peptidase (beta-lactamase class C family)
MSGYGPDMTLLPDLQRWLDEAATRHDVPGAAVAVGVGDELAEAATGVVNRDTGVEATTDSVFQIGSVTKVWTASLVMQLVDDGFAVRSVVHAESAVLGREPEPSQARNPVRVRHFCQLSALATRADLLEEQRVRASSRGCCRTT